MYATGLAPRCLAACVVDSKDALQKLWPRMCTEVLGTTLLMCHRFWKLEVDWSLWIRGSLSRTATRQQHVRHGPWHLCVVARDTVEPVHYVGCIHWHLDLEQLAQQTMRRLPCTVVALDCRRKEMPMPSNLSCTSSAFIALEETPHPLHSRHNSPGCTRRNPMNSSRLRSGSRDMFILHVQVQHVQVQWKQSR